MKISFKSFEGRILILSFFLLILSAVPRFYDIYKFLPNYSIDENDIVEFAVGYFGGDIDPHWYKYGPLYSYILSIVYAIQALFSPLDLNSYAQQIFFEPSSFYYTARFVNSLINLVLVFFSYKIARKYFNTKIAVLTVLIAVFPFFDILTSFRIRVDTLLALWAVITLYFTLHVFETGKLKYYLLSGLFFGLAIATKPIPSLLIMPTIFLAHYFGYIKDIAPSRQEINRKKKQKKKQKKSVEKNVVQKITESVFNKKFILLLCTGIAANFVFNPYSLINFEGFKVEQVNALMTEGGRNFTPGWDVSRFFGTLGYTFIGFASIAIIYYLYKSIKNKDLITLILLSYIVIFWLAFAKGAARDYFYVPIITVIVIFIAKLFLEISEYAGSLNEKLKNPTVFILLIVLFFQPASWLYSQSRKLNAQPDYAMIHSGISGKMWIENEINYNSKILMYGYYTSLPRLVDFDMNEQANIGEYFMYFRWKNEYLKKMFSEAHQKYIKNNNPAYDLHNIRNDLKEKEQFLYNFCIQNKIEYVITYFNLDKYQQFKDKKLKTFEPPQYPFGMPFSIYKF